MINKRSQAALLCVLIGGVLVWLWGWQRNASSDRDEGGYGEFAVRTDQQNVDTVSTTRDPHLNEYLINGRVVNSTGSGITEALVSVKQPLDEAVEVLTKEDGPFSLNFLHKSESVEIEISAPSHFSQEVTITPDDSDITVTLLRTGLITGTATDRQSNIPVENFTVSLFKGRTLSSTSTPELSATFSDLSGKFEITDLDHNQVDLYANADGYLPFTIREISIGENSESINLLFGRARKITGRVTSANSGLTIVGAQIIAIDSNASHDPMSRFLLPHQMSKTSKDGIFSFDEASADSTIIRTTADGFASSVVEVSTEDESHVEIKLHAASAIAGQLFDVDGVESLAGRIQIVGKQSDYERSTWSNKSGRFTFEDVPAGEYTLSATSAVGQSNQIEFAVENGEQLDDFRLQIVRGVRLTGRVSGLMDGEDVVSIVAIHYAPENPNGRQVAMTNVDSAGYYELRGLPVGRIVISLATTAGRSLSQSATLEGQSEAKYVDFIF